MRDDDVVKSFKALDPVDGDAVADRVPDEEWRAMIGRITAAPRGARRAWRRPVTKVGAFVVVTATFFAFASAIAGDRTITVDAADALRSPASVEKRLSEEGISADVYAVPVKDDLVGKWFHLYLDPRADVDAGTFALLKSYVGELDFGYDTVAERCPGGAGCDRTSILEIPGDVKGPMTLVVGRAAGANESYWAENMDWGNELAPSGALYCLALEEKSPEEAAVLLEAKGYRVEWTYDAPRSAPDGERSGSVDEPPVGTGITVAYSPAPGVINLRTTALSELDHARASAGTPTAESGRPDYGTC